jgi:probable rRNA maturation factor
MKEPDRRGQLRRAKATKPPSTTVQRDIEISVRHRRLRCTRAVVKSLIHTLDAAAASFRGGCPAGTLSLAFLDDQGLAELHGRFLDDPSTTDVITFEGQALLAHAGEVCVSVDTAERYACEHGRDFSTELSLYVVHGWLHLAGYDDLQPALKREMRRAESRALKLLEAEGLLRAFGLKQALSDDK